MSSSLISFPAPCVLITGMPGAGKSTVSDLLAQRLPRAARLNGDAVSAMITSGRVWALGDPADEALRQVQLMHENLAVLSQKFTAAGFAVIIDTVIPDRAQLDALVAKLGGSPMLVVLAPGVRTCRSRNEGRAEHERWTFSGYDDLEAQMIDGFGDQGWWFDTADLTPERTVDRIIAEATTLARLPIARSPDPG